MGRWKYWPPAHSMAWPKRGAVPPPSPKDLARGIAWPIPAEWCIRFVDAKTGLFVDVELYRDPDESSWIVTGIAVRSGVKTDPDADGLDWLEGARVPSVSPRTVRSRMPLSGYVDAATAIVDDLFGTEGRLEAIKPRGAPPKGMDFYIAVRDEYLRLKKARRDPVPEIAASRGVRPDTVHQWVFRMRHNFDPPLLPMPKKEGRMTRRKGSKR